MTLLYLYKKLERHVHPVTQKTFRSFPLNFFKDGYLRFLWKRRFAPCFEDDSDFSGSESSGEEGNESTATVKLALALPPRRLKPTVRIQTPVSLNSL